MAEPKKWQDMTPQEKGALFVAHHEGKMIETSQDGKDWALAPGQCWVGYGYYRVKPPEPRVWWLNVYDGYVVAHNTKAEAFLNSKSQPRPKECVRVVECPDG
jgi:hypothetical protein